MNTLTKELVGHVSGEKAAQKFASVFPLGVDVTEENMAEIFRERLVPAFSSAFILFSWKEVQSFMADLHSYLDLGSYPDHDYCLVKTDESIVTTAKAWAERFRRASEKTPEEYQSAADNLDAFIYG